jgi:hypothetical protein
MSWSVAETFERVRKHLPASLSSDAVERCARIAARIPDEACAHYLEFRLNSGNDVDFLTLSPDKRIGERLDAQLGRDRSPTWSENVAILREWATPGSDLSDAPFVCFEYDAGSRFVETEPEASLVIGLEQHYRRRFRTGLHPRDESSVSLGKVAFRRLLPESSRDACMAALERCYAALPPLGAIPHAPVMAAREPIAAKPYVILPRASVFRFLDDIGWPGSRSALKELLATYYAPFSESIYLDVTITDRVSERLGIATSQFQRREADFSSLGWWRLPRELECFRDELGEWDGYTEERLGGERVWLRRWLDTKAVLFGTKVEYKAYLGFSPTRPPLFC